MSHMDKNNSNSSILELIKEIAQLTILLIWKLLLKAFKLLLKLCKSAISSAKAGIIKCRNYWNDTSTQNKIKKAKAGLRKLASAILKGLVRFLKITARLLILFLKCCIHTILHIRPALKKLMHLLRRCTKSIKRSIKRRCIKTKLFFRRKKKSYNNFRKNKGFKGFLMDMNRSLKTNIKKYMDEEQTDVDDDAPDEEEKIEKMLQIEENSSKAEILGKKIFSSVKNIVDLSDEEESTKRKKEDKGKK